MTPPILWLVEARYKNAVNVGDDVYIWRADAGRKGTGGAVAFGTISEEPIFREDEPRAKALWTDPKDSDKDWRAGVRLKDVRLTAADGMLLRTKLKEHPALAKMLIFGFAAATTFPLKDDEAAVMMRLWAEAKP